MAHIQTLFFTFLWNFAPELIQNGYVYASVPPLYKIVVGKETFYLKDDTSLAEYQAKNVGKKYTVQRFKGYELVWPLSTFPLIRGVA